MLISYKWLKKYLPELDNFSKNNIAEVLTLKLAEVETIKPVRQELKLIVCGEIIDVEAISGSKKLSKCLVNTGEKELRSIVCGAPNVSKGIKVAVCLPGGTAYDAHSNVSGSTFVVESRPVMGTLSDGVICSARELGLSNEHEGILILESELLIGLDLTSFLVDDVFEIENKSISHRPDCFCHQGIAREISAMLVTPFQDNFEEHPLIPTKKLDFEVQVKVDSSYCSRFTTICIADIKVGNSPLWLQSMLSAVGTRPINNVVDAANYVMFDKGQPLHTYDFDKIDSHKLIVRTAKNEEKITTLDGKEYELDQEMLVIANGNKIDDIAGIMGGANSEITNETKNIIIEAANFNMYSIRKTSRKLGIRTEASTRFEKGQDPNNALVGLKSAVQLISDLAQGEIASEISDYYVNPRGPLEIEIDLLKVKRFLGIELTVREIIDFLERLHLEVRDTEKIPSITALPSQNTLIKINIPSFRSDLKIEEDILEEIARLYGYENFNPTLPLRPITALRLNKGSRLQRVIGNSLIASGLDEIYTYSFVGKKLYENLGLKIEDCLKIRNPLSPELSHIRNLVLPNLIEKIATNTKRYSQFQFFEIGRVALQDFDINKIHIQPIHVAGLTYSALNEMQFPIVKGVVENLFAELAIKVSFRPLSENDNYAAKPLLHPGRSALIMIGEQVLGFVGELHPATVSNLDLTGRVGIFEIDASILSGIATYENEFKAISVFQSIKRDLSYVVENSTSFGDLVAEIDNLSEPLIKGVSFVDVFTKSDDLKNKSITISIELQSQDRTLIDEDIVKVIDQISLVLTKKFKATLRSN